MKPSPEETYEILKAWVRRGEPNTYKPLSLDYQKRTGDWFEPHGSWDLTLGEINSRLSRKGAPAITAIVILKEENEPGRNFWGCAPNVPSRPSNYNNRMHEWNNILSDIFSFNWSNCIL